jgi:hypothetical protein
MSRISVYWAVVFGLVTHAQAQSQEGRDPHEGPAPVDSSASLLARPDDDSFGQLRTQRGDASGTAHEHPAGTYTGVAPGSGTPAVPIVPSKNPATITWPGFQMRPDGTSRVFIQSTTALDPQPLPTTPGKYLIRLPGARVSGETNRLPLDTRFFNTPVTRVSVSVHRDGTQLLLDLRAEVTPQISSERGAGGFYFTYIDLPKGQYVAGADKPKVASAAIAPAAERGSAPPPAPPAFPPPPQPPPEPVHTTDANVHAGASLQAGDDEAPPVVKGRLNSRIKLGK